MGRTGSDPRKVFFSYPRTSSSGSAVITASTPLRSGWSPSGYFYGVLIFNLLARDLSNAINGIRILTNGYAFLIDGG
jgi:hypothetical protein